ncbi:hypothetical protein LCGC14_2198740 [marine sediment metagenome]|uniref:Uncharacterized protein n=1 Tax=marine sediment metagenome TaxID=412755 RepID=A0A0F9FUS8_9ZZZZ
MIIKGTNSIKGVIDLSSIPLQMTKGQSVTIKDSDFYNSDVQTALKMGWLVAEGKPSVIEEIIDEEKEVLCLNAHHRPLGLSQFDTDISPGQSFRLKASDLNLPDIKMAVEKGMITIVPDSVPTDYTEATVSVGQALSVPDDGINLEDALDTNEELIVPTKLLQPKTAIKDKKKPVVWNKSAEVKAVQSPTQVINTFHPKPVNPNVGDPKRSSIVMSPTGRPQKTAMRRGIQEAITEDLEFIDESSEKERRSKHPILGKKPLPQNVEVDLIVEDEAAEQRRKSHPILGKKDRDEGEKTDFI